MALKETKELLKFAIELGEAMDKATADKKIDITDVQFLIVPLTSAGAAFEGADKVTAELKAMSAEDAAELVKFAQDELQLSNEKLEEKIETALKLAVDLFKYVQLFKKVVA